MGWKKEEARESLRPHAMEAKPLVLLRLHALEEPGVLMGMTVLKALVESAKRVWLVPMHQPSIPRSVICVLLEASQRLQVASSRPVNVVGGQHWQRRIKDPDCRGPVRVQACS